MMTGNIMDYLEWYGDFDFSVMPFNEVDNLILAELSYASLDGIVPEPQLGRKLRPISVKEAALKLDESGRLEKAVSWNATQGFSCLRWLRAGDLRMRYLQDMLTNMTLKIRSSFRHFMCICPMGHFLSPIRVRMIPY